MKQTLILLITVGLVVSCSETGNKNATSDTITLTQPTDVSSVKPDRQILIKELRRLQSIFASNDKEKVADLFPFPISNENIGIYIDDSSFNAQYEKNGHKTTRGMFLDHYPDISEILQIDQVNELFKKLNIDKLLDKDTVGFEAIIKTEPCYHFYEVKVENAIVTLSVGTNSNENYKSKILSEDEMAENDSSICEHVLWWMFRFDGKKLHFKEISGAG